MDVLLPLFLFYNLFSLHHIISTQETDPLPLLNPSFESYLSIPLTCTPQTTPHNLPCFPLSTTTTTTTTTTFLSIQLDSPTSSLLPLTLDPIALTVVQFNDSGSGETGSGGTPLTLNETLISFWVETDTGGGTGTPGISIWVSLVEPDGRFFGYTYNHSNLFEFSSFAEIRIYFGYNPILGSGSGSDSGYVPAIDSKRVPFGGTMFHFVNASGGSGTGCSEEWGVGVNAVQFPELFDVKERYVKIDSVYALMEDWSQSDSGHYHHDSNFNTPDYPPSTVPDVGYATVDVSLTNSGSDEFFVGGAAHFHELDQWNVDLELTNFDRVVVGMCALDAPRFVLGEGAVVWRVDDGDGVSIDDIFDRGTIGPKMAGRLQVLHESGSGTIGSVFPGGHTHTPLPLPRAGGTSTPDLGVNHFCVDSGGAANAVGSHDLSETPGWNPVHRWYAYHEPSPDYPPFVWVEFLQAKRDALPVSSIVMFGDSLPPMGWEELPWIRNRLLRGVRAGEDQYIGVKGGNAVHNHTVPPVSSIFRDVWASCLAGPTTIPSTHSHTIHGISENRPNWPFTVSFKAFRRIVGANAIVAVSSPSLVKMRLFCFGVSSDIETVCSSAGDCLGENSCRCYSSNFGAECELMCGTEGEAKANGEVWIPFRTRVSLLLDQQWFGSSGLAFPCSNLILEGGGCEIDGVCTCRFEAVGFKTESLVIVPGDEKLPSVLLRLPVDPVEELLVTVARGSALVIDVVLPIAVASAVILAALGVVGTVILCICCAKARQQKKNLDKLDQLEDVDLLIAEQEARKKEDSQGSLFSAMKVNKELFVVEYMDVKLEEEIGRGGSDCVVFRARWKNLTVAFKLFNFSLGRGSTETFLGEFEREVSILASVHHPSLLSFYGAAVRPPRIGIVLEYCENGDLKQFLLEQSDYPLEERYRMCVEIASAMQYLHSLQIIHRDLKAANILVSKSCEIRVMDFGLSRMLKDRSVDDSAKMTTMIGTSGYMAPELVTGSGAYSGAVDVFSFAILVFETLTGEFDWSGNRSLNLEFEMATNGLRPPLHQIHAVPSFKRLVSRMWDTDPKFRPGFPEIAEVFDGFKDQVLESFEYLPTEGPEGNSPGTPVGRRVASAPGQLARQGRRPSVKSSSGVSYGSGGVLERLQSALVRKGEDLVAFARSLLGAGQRGGYHPVPNDAAAREWIPPSRKGSDDSSVWIPPSQRGRVEVPLRRTASFAGLRPGDPPPRPPTFGLRNAPVPPRPRPTSSFGRGRPAVPPPPSSRPSGPSLHSRAGSYGSGNRHSASPPRPPPPMSRSLRFDAPAPRPPLAMSRSLRFDASGPPQPPSSRIGRRTSPASSSLPRRSAPPPLRPTGRPAPLPPMSTGREGPRPLAVRPAPRPPVIGRPAPAPPVARPPAPSPPSGSSSFRRLPPPTFVNQRNFQ